MTSEFSVDRNNQVGPAGSIPAARDRRKQMFDFETYTSKSDLVSILELMECSSCGEPHFGCYETCPHCGASVYHQYSISKEEYSLDELKQKARKCKEHEGRKMIAKGKEILKQLGLEE
jgi:hypothetical protein